MKRKPNKKEICLTNEEYLKQLLNNNSQIKGGELLYTVHRSSNKDSISIYIDFDAYGQYTKPYRVKTLRISDHLLPEDNLTSTQFIINPDKILTKKRRIMLEKTITNIIQKAHIKVTKRTINFLKNTNKEGEKQNENT